MPRPMAVHVMRLLMVALTALCPVVLSGQAQVLRPLDSVRVRERDNVELGRPNAMAVTARGDAFVSDIADRKVVRISRAGDVTVVAARGAGPGEVISPTGLAMLGDSLLVVRNVGRRRLEYFDPRSGAYMGGRSYSGPSTGFSAWSGQVLMGSLRQGDGTRPRGRRGRCTPARTSHSLAVRSRGSIRSSRLPRRCSRMWRWGEMRRSCTGCSRSPTGCIGGRWVRAPSTQSCWPRERGAGPVRS